MDRVASLDGHLKSCAGETGTRCPKLARYRSAKYLSRYGFLRGVFEQRHLISLEQACSFGTSEAILAEPLCASEKFFMQRRTPSPP